MVDVTSHIEINVPLREVASYACDPDNVPRWYANIRSVTWKTPKSLQVGSQITFVAKFLGKELIYTYEIVEFSNHRFVMKTADSPFPMETTYTFNVKNADITLMSISNKGNPSGFYQLFEPFMSFMMKRANKKDLKMVKFILEKNIERKPE